MPQIIVRLTDQQLELVGASLAADEAPDAPSLVRLALRETAEGVVRRHHPRTTGRPWHWWDGLEPPAERESRLDVVLEPGTGKAFEVRAGEILRVEQITGDQCVDLNVFNLHDYREFMHVGRTRTLHGTNPSTGSFLWSAPPRERALMYLQTDTAGINDTLFPRCSANMYESMHGFADHTNCADIQAEAQREYGLTPDDVHDSFNLFMATRVVDGMPEILRQSTAPKDHVELLALVDVLAVPNICGNDIMGTSNFSLNPVRVEVLAATRTEIDAVPPLRTYATQRTPADFRQPTIRTERRLSRVPGYEPAFARTPVGLEPVVVELDESDAARLAALHDTERYADQGDALRDVLLSWWVASLG
jgi:uncharacterized protein YcgI (DUF1989 family)